MVPKNEKEGGDEMKNTLTQVAMTKLEFIKLITDLSGNEGNTVTINIEGKPVTLKTVSSLCLGSIYAIFESDNGERIRLEIADGEDFNGPVSAKILNSNYVEEVD